jgi:hypothetical protein
VRLTDAQIIAVCRELLGPGTGTVKVLDVQAELWTRFQAKGKTARVAGLLKRIACSAELRSAQEVVLQGQFEKRVFDAERIAREALNRAEESEARAVLAEERERSHQDRWAMQLDDLRQKLLASQKDSARVPELERRILDLHRQLAGVAR